MLLQLFFQAHIWMVVCPHVAKTSKESLLKDKHIQVNCKKEEEQEPSPIATIKSLMKDLEDEVSLRNTLASEQKNPSSMQNTVRNCNDLT
jgi:hypothetical protein